MNTEVRQKTDAKCNKTKNANEIIFYISHQIESNWKRTKFFRRCWYQRQKFTKCVVFRTETTQHLCERHVFASSNSTLDGGSGGGGNSSSFSWSWFHRRYIFHHISMESNRVPIKFTGLKPKNDQSWRICFLRPTWHFALAVFLCLLEKNTNIH